MVTVGMASVGHENIGTRTLRAKVLLCGPPLSAMGGGPTHMNNLLVSPLRERYKIVHFESGSRGSESPAKDEPFVSKIFRIVTSPLALAGEIVRARPEIVHLNSAADWRAFWRDAIYLLVCRLFRRKVVFQLHGGSLNQLSAHPWMRMVVRWVFSKPDAVVLLAATEVRDFAKLGITERLIVIPNGIDLAPYRACKRVHSGRVQRLVYIGRLLRTKGIFEAIEAVDILRADPRFSDIELRIAGSGPAHAEIQKVIAERGLTNHVKLVGPLFGNDKIAFLCGADVFLFPSYHPEGLPYSILESLAAGTPVIASNVAGIPDVVTDRVHGVLINPRSPREVVSAVEVLGTSAETLRAMSADCADWAVERLGLARLAADFDNLYEKILVPQRDAAERSRTNKERIQLERVSGHGRHHDDESA